MKNLKKIIRFLAAVIGYGWLWGSGDASAFTRVHRENGEIETYHTSFAKDCMENDFWPYGSKSEELFRANFPGEKITGSGSGGTGTYIVSRPVS